MKHASTALFLLAAAINLAPAVGIFFPERMEALYALSLEDSSLEILMRHRAVLFGLVGSFLVAAALHRPLRALGYIAGFVSMISFLLIAWVVGDYSEQLRSVAVVDLVGIASLTGAGIVDVAESRWKQR